MVQLYVGGRHVVVSEHASELQVLVASWLAFLLGEQKGEASYSTFQV